MELEYLLAQLFESIMTAPWEDIFDWREVDFDFPEKAQIRRTLQCSRCGEGVMEGRAISIEDEVLCPSCYLDKGGQ